MEASKLYERVLGRREMPGTARFRHAETPRVRPPAALQAAGRGDAVAHSVHRGEPPTHLLDRLDAYLEAIRRYSPRFRALSLRPGDEPMDENPRVEGPRGYGRSS